MVASKEGKMNSRFVPIRREKLVKFLQACGFTPRVVGRELVYCRPNSHHGDVVVKVYTSLPAAGGDARAKGQDAIHVTCAYESDLPFRGRTSFGIFKATRTFRTGSEEAILERLHGRMQEAYAAGNAWLRKNWEALQKR